MINKHIIVDRIVGEFAVCEDGDKMIDIPLSQLPKGVKDGDVLTKNETEYFINKELTQQTRQNNINLQNSLWED